MCDDYEGTRKDKKEVKRKGSAKLDEEKATTISCILFLVFVSYHFLTVVLV